MKVIYIDDNFKCHVNRYDGTLREVYTDFFDGKCDEFVEGYRFVPSGENWTREDGTVFVGEMIAPWKDFSELHILQIEYEKKDAENALSILLGGGSE
jgi:hypothetical protein